MTNQTYNSQEPPQQPVVANTDNAILAQYAAIAESNQRLLQEVENLSKGLIGQSEEVKAQSKKIKDQGDTILSVQNLTFLGFLVLLITVAGIVISVIMYELQTQQQTVQLLQGIKESTNKIK